MSFGFVGAGFHATRNIIPSFIEAGGIINGMSTRSKMRSAAALSKAGSSATGKPFDDYKLMLTEVDSVIIITQPKDAVQVVLDCLKAGKNVFCDKPLGMTAQEAAQVAQEVHGGKVLMAGFMKRFAPIYTHLKQIIASHDLSIL